jgi:hypothetical protein
VHLLRTRKPSLQRAYLSGLDEIQHAHGSGSPDTLSEAPRRAGLSTPGDGESAGGVATWTAGRQESSALAALLPVHADERQEPMLDLGGGRLASVSEAKRTADGFVIAFPPLEGDTSFAPDPVIEAYKKDVDRGLIVENLKLTVDERMRQLVAMQRFAAEVGRAGRAAFGD